MGRSGCGKRAEHIQKARGRRRYTAETELVPLGRESLEVYMEIMLEVPDQYLVDQSPTELARRIKLYAALLMFQSEELSAGAAAELAEVDRFTFAVECQKHGIPLVDYSAEDLGAELASLRNRA
jgi:predicted HTH domain antitoxin